MILTALKELAEREGLVKNADYQPVPVRWLVTIGEAGQPHGDFRDTLQPPVDGKGKPTAARFDIPKRSNRTVQNHSEFVIDKPEYVFGWSAPEERDNPDPAKGKKLRERAQARHKMYVEELKLAAEVSGDEGLAALVQYFAAFDTNEGQALPPDLVSGDLIGFLFATGVDPPTMVTDRAKVVAYWANRRRQPECGTGKAETIVTALPTPSRERSTTCLVTGEACEPVALHPKLKGIPPVSKTKGGVPLTSVNASAFDSYELGGIGGAVVSRVAADAYEKALNRLLADGYPSPTDGTPMPRRNFQVSDDTVVVFWSKGDPAAVDLFSDAVGTGEPEAVRAVYNSVWKGKSLDLGDPSAFYTLTLTGGQGRGTVRGWHETTLGAALKNLKQYFADLDIIRPPNDEGKPRPLLGLIRQLAVQGKLDNVPSGLAADLFSAILAGRPFPRAILDTTVRRVRAERTIYGDRVSLVKAYLCRSGHLPAPRPQPNTIPTCEERFVVLNEDFAEPGYRLGRLFAVLEKLQDDAIGASAGIRDRYYGAASATPVIVFPQLLRKAPHHLSKLGGGQETYFEKLIQTVFAGLLPPAPFPRVLTLEQQGLFAVGYYHQRQALFMKREAKPDPPNSQES
jgi:CRISPR-associated protein Csd1